MKSSTISILALAFLLVLNSCSSYSYKENKSMFLFWSRIIEVRNSRELSKKEVLKFYANTVSDSLAMLINFKYHFTNNKKLDTLSIVAKKQQDNTLSYIDIFFETEGRTESLRVNAPSDFGSVSILYLAAADFDRDGLDDLLIGMPTNSVSKYASYSILSFANASPFWILPPNLEEYNQYQQASLYINKAELYDDFLLDISVGPSNQKYLLDISNNKKIFIKEKIYSSSGGLLSSTATPRIDYYGLLLLSDSDKDGVFELEGYQTVRDPLGYIIGQFKSIWSYQDSGWQLLDLQFIIRD